MFSVPKAARQKVVVFCSGRLGRGGVKVLRRWNVTTLNNFLVQDVWTLHAVIWFALEIWIEIMDCAFSWLQGTGMKPPCRHRLQAISKACREKQEQSLCHAVGGLKSLSALRVLEPGRRLREPVCLGCPGTTLPEAAAAGSPHCCAALQTLAAISWAQACSDPSKWFPCSGYVRVFPFSPRGWNNVPGSMARCACVTRPEMFSCLQSVTFILTSFLELQNLILCVLLRRLSLPLW